jgi:Methyltransferase domain
MGIPETWQSKLMSIGMVPSAAAGRGTKTSFRDPQGQVAIIGRRVIRKVQPAAAAYLLDLLQSETGKRWIDQELVVRSRPLDPAEIEALVSDPATPELFRGDHGDIILEHERVAFPSYPYEWSPEMLVAAGKLTIRLARESLDNYGGLKDATPSNILFCGARPIFVDVLSFEPRFPDDPTWLAHAQFTRTFLLPLLANRYFQMPLDQVFVTRRDGLEPEELYPYLGALQRIRPPFLDLVSFPTWLARKSAAEGEQLYKRRSKDTQMARFLLQSLLNRMERTLDRLAPRQPNSVWSNYLSGNNNYTSQMFATKERFVRGALELAKPARVLDVGCNTGHFSRIAARAGSSVVSIDYDPVVVGQVWRSAAAEGLDILPLVVNLSRPSPGVGWANEECVSFLDRARGAFDCVFMLAVIHHMLVTDRIPLESIISLVGELTSKYAVIEFIEVEDSMFRRLLRGRGELHRNLTPAKFEAVCQESFDILRCEHIEGSFRRLYLLRKREDQD